MKMLIFLFVLMTTAAGQSIYDFKINSLEGDEIDFKRYNGKTLLIVNVASKCGNTPQYADLQKLHEEYGDVEFLQVSGEAGRQCHLLSLEGKAS